MADNTTPAAATFSTITSLAFAANIQTHVRVTLDLKETNYKTWRELFFVTLGKFNLMLHIDGSPQPSPNDQPD